MSGGKSGKWKVPFSNERLQTSKRTMALSFDLKFALSARHNTAYNNEHKKRVTVPVKNCYSFFYLNMKFIIIVVY